MSLSPEHARRIRDSGVSDEVRDARGYRTVEDVADLERLGFAPAQRRVPALLVPVHDVRGEVVSYQIRPDTPRVNQRGKPLKYEFPKGSRMVLDVPPGARPKIGDPKVTLLITEGARKADAAVSRGMVCISVPGVYGWRGRNDDGGATALADWESVALKDRSVVLAFDSDVTTKREVKSALRRLKGFLESRGARVKVAHLRSSANGEKVGLDDFLAAGMTEADLLSLATDRVEVGPSDPNDKRPEVVVSTQIKDLVDAAEKALAEHDPEVFHRSGELVRLRARRDAPPVIESLPLPTLTERLSAVARWVAIDKRADSRKPVVPPRDVVTALHARGRWPNLPELVAVVTSPTLRPDGTVLETQGYDRASGIYFAPPPGVTFPSVSPSPRYTDALQALEALREPFVDFPFKARSDRSAALALVLTLVGRRAIRGPVPLFAVRAPERGEGKSLLVHTAATIATGSPAPVGPQPRNPDEERKLLFSVGLEGREIHLFDNVERGFGSDVLAAALTATMFRDRLLGASRTVEVPLPLFCATGTNMELVGDLGRRTLLIDIAAGVERPEERSGFKHPELIAWVQAERSRLVAAALTVLRWWYAEGCPAPSMTAFGSYEAWSSVVRSPLLWLGEADPCEGRERLRDDGDAALEAHRIALDVWARVLGEQPFTVSEVVAAAGREADLRHALAGLDTKLDADRLDQRRLGYVLRRIRDRILAGRVLERSGQGHGGVATWRVRTLPATSITTMTTISPPLSPPLKAAPLAGSDGNGGDGGDSSCVYDIARARAHARAEPPETITTMTTMTTGEVVEGYVANPDEEGDPCSH